MSDAFGNILNASGSPDSPDDHTLFGFVDHGAWHALTHNPKATTGYGGLYLLDKNRWTAKQMMQANILIIEDGEQCCTCWGLPSEQSYFPGLMEQSHKDNNVQLDEKTIFISNRTSLYQMTIEVSDQTKSISAIEFTSSFFDSISIISKNPNEIKLQLSEGSVLLINSSFELSEVEVHRDEALWVLKFAGKTKEELHKGSTIEFNYTITYLPDGKRDQLVLQKAILAVENPGPFFTLNEQRWEKYLNKVLKPKPEEEDFDAEDIMAVKCIETLMMNWRSPAGSLHHDGLVPSFSVGFFDGFWAWDSWKHAVALARFEPELAKSQIMAMYDYQDEYGMIADCVFADSTQNNWRDTKPPLSGWAIFEVFDKTRDTTFLRNIFPKLEKYHNWWYLNRDHDSNGLCEYGSTDGTRIAAAWESGMDNAVRFDDAVMLKNNDLAWSLDQESVDLNAYLVAEKVYLSILSTALNDTARAKNYTLEADKLAGMINDLFWDEETGYYYDRKLYTGELINIPGPEGWIPLWAKISRPKHAAGIRNMIVDTNTFNTFVPFPTLAANQTEFNPLKGYWRGPVWIDQAWFAIDGLKAYGYDQEAKLMRDKLLQNANGLLDKGKPIHENYHPLTGEALNAENFSWSAAHFLLLYLD
jgi:putative isomerase